MNTRPAETAGEECSAPPVVAVQSGWHTCDGLQFVAPVASKALNLPLLFPTYKTPFATAGEESMAPPVENLRWATQTPALQPATPAASNA